MTYYQQPAYWPAPRKTASGLGIASLVLGIIAFLGCLFPIAGVLLAGLGLLLGFCGLMQDGRTTAKGTAVAGVILNTIVLLPAIIGLLFFGAVFSACLAAGNHSQPTVPEATAPAVPEAPAMPPPAPLPEPESSPAPASSQSRAPAPGPSAPQRRLPVPERRALPVRPALPASPVHPAEETVTADYKVKYEFGPGVVNVSVSFSGPTDSSRAYATLSLIVQRAVLRYPGSGDVRGRAVDIRSEPMLLPDGSESMIYVAREKRTFTEKELELWKSRPHP